MFKELKSKFKGVVSAVKLVKDCYNQLEIIKKNPSAPEAKEAGYKFLWMIKELYAQYKKEGFKALAQDQFLEHLSSYPNNETAFRKKAEQDNIIQERNGHMEVKTDPQSDSDHTQPLESFGKELLQKITHSEGQ